MNLYRGVSYQYVSLSHLSCATLCNVLMSVVAFSALYFACLNVVVWKLCWCIWVLKLFPGPSCAIIAMHVHACRISELIKEMGYIRNKVYVLDGVPYSAEFAP